MPKESSRDKFIEAGISLFMRSGFTATGLHAIIEESQAPKGSFYNYFESKEAFALAVIDSYFETFAAITAKHLTNGRATPLKRLRAYFQELISINQKGEWREGCLLGILGREMAGQNEVLRKKIDLAFKHWSAGIEQCIREGQAAGEIRDSIPAETLADLLLNAWQGALLRMSVERRRAPLDYFCDILLNSVLLA